MSSLLAEDSLITATTAKTATAATTAKTTTTATAAAKSLLALALHAWSLCVLLVLLVALIFLTPAFVVIVFPVVCMATAVYLLCAITARLLVPFRPPDPARERRARARERKQDCVEVDRAEAPGGFDDDASSVEEEHGEGAAVQQRGRHELNSADAQGFRDYCHGEQRRFFFVDTYYKSFYDLLAFWRSMERGEWM